MGSRQRGRQMQVVYVKMKLHFSIDREVSGSDALPPRICVHPPRWSASTTVRRRRDIRCHQQRWPSSKSVDNTAHFSVTHMWQRSIACSFRDSWAYCNDACVQNHARSRCCRKWCKCWYAICVIHTTVGQHLNWYRVSRGSLGDSSASCWM